MRSALIFILDRFTGSLKWTNSAKFVVETDVTFFSKWKSFVVAVDYVTCICALTRTELCFVYCCKVMWLGLLFVYENLIYCWVYLYVGHSFPFSALLPSITFFMLLFQFLSSLSYSNSFFFTILPTLSAWTHSAHEKFSPLSHIPIGSLINNADGTCASVKVFGFLS